MEARFKLWFNVLIKWLVQFKLELLITTVLCFLTLFSRLSTTLLYPIEVGLDGAYYTINVFTLLNGGFLYYDAPIVSFAIAAAFSLITHDIIIGVKIASALFEAILVVGVFFAAWSFTRGDWRAGFIAGVLCWIDVSQFQLVTSLVKNQAALAFLPFALVFFYRFKEKGRHLYDFVGFLIFGCLTTLSHLMTAAILFATLIVFTGSEFIKQLWAREWRVALQDIAFPLLMGGLVFVGVYVASDLLIPAADTWYTSSSLIKASGYTTSLLWGENIVSLVNFLFMGVNPLLGPISWDLWLHLGIAILIVTSILILLVRNQAGDRAALALLFSTTLLGLGLASWAFRFNGMLFVPLHLILAMGLVVIVDKLVEFIRIRSVKLQTVRYGKQILALVFIFIVLGGILWIAIPRYILTATHIRPRASPQDLASIEAMQGMFPNDVKLYAAHGLEYFITSRTWYEAEPESGTANFPVYAAQRMYYNLNNNSRFSYYIVEPGSQFLGSLQPIQNDLLRVLSFGYFDLFKDTMEIIIQTTSPISDIRCILTSMSDPSASMDLWLTESPGNIWQGNLSLIFLPDGMHRCRIVPFINPSPAPPDFANIIGDQDLLLLYHFEDIPTPHVQVPELLVLEGKPGWYQIYGVNTTMAEAIDLPNLDVMMPDFPGPPRPPDPYMLILTPLYYLPFYGELSNFVIILILSPLLGLYWLFGGLLLGRLVRGIYLRYGNSIRKLMRQD